MTSRLSVQPARLGFATIEDDEDDYTPYNELVCWHDDIHTLVFSNRDHDSDDVYD